MIQPSEQNEIMRGFDRIFEDFRSNFEDLLWPSDRIWNRAYSIMPRLTEEAPLIDLEDNGKDFCLTVEVPGFKKEDIRIEVEDKAVDIRGSRSMQDEEKAKDYVRRERGYESFHRRIDLPEEINADKTEASMNDGILELHMPKKSPKTRTKVNIK